MICFIFPFPFFHFESLLRVLGVLGLKNHLQVELFLFPRFSAGAQRTVPYAQVTKSTTSGCGSAVNFDDVKAKVIRGLTFFFTIQSLQNGQMLGINEGKRRRKLAVNKDKSILFRMPRTVPIPFLSFCLTA